MNTDDPTTANRTAAQSDPDEPATTVHRFIRTLLQRYRTLRDADATALPDEIVVDERLSELLLAEAALRYARRAADEHKKRPPQLAVLGPTQTGKSTIVNLILGTQVAEVSPLAGFTTHPQGFWIGAGSHRSEPGAKGELAEGWAAELFPGWQRCPAGELSRDELERYTLTDTGGTPVPPMAATDETPVPPTPPAGLPPCVVWDTPDFDSLAARAYRRGVLEVAALADAHVFVLSKEKYSDLSVWKMLRLLSPLGRPLVICLNKLTPDAAEPVTASLKRHLAGLGSDAADTPIVTFDYQPEFGTSADLDTLPGVSDLRERIATRLTRVAAPAQELHDGGRSPGLRALVRQHWSDWTAPIEVELAAVGAWNGRVEAALGEGLESYRRDFLDHPQRFDTFRRATGELLHLLELPGLGGVVSQVRHTLSWPARRLFAAQQAWSARRRRPGGAPHGLGSEEVVLFEIVERLLTSLERDAARRSDPATPGHAIWRALARRLERQQARLRETFQNAAQKQREEFAPVIHATANRLYEALQQRPVMLNALRAARATTDVASIALAIKTGGLNINDLLFAPAMFALISMLTEGALGSYMLHVANDLRKRQLEHVRTRLIEDVFASELRGLAVDLKDPGLFGISADRLHLAAQALDAWEQSDDE